MLLAASGEDAGLDALLAEAQQHIENERLNVDYTPSVVSVIEHDQMAVLGIKTLFEALSIMPGVETSVSHFGVKKVIVRGSDNPDNFTFDKTLLKIDGVPIETAFLSNTGTYLELPVDVIERIELLRGPASALYGNGAYNGVINVITRHHPKNGSGLFFSGGSYGYRMGGGRVVSQLDPETVLHLDAYVQRSEKQLDADASFAMKHIYVPDVGPIDFPRDPQSNEQLNDYSIGITLLHEGWSLRTRYKERESGNYYGWNERLELTADHRNKEKYFFVEAAYDTVVADATDLKTSIQFSRYDLTLDAQDYYKDSGSGYFIPYEFSLYESEDKYRIESELTSRTFGAHTIISGVLWQSIRERSNEISDELSPYGDRPMVTEGLRRDSVALYARDTWDVSEEVAILMALRGDYYTKEEKLYPSAQLGALYTPDDRVQFKFNYGHAFRVPSWVEAYSIEYGPGDGTRPGDSDLEAETTDTFEAVAIMHQNRQRFKFNAYYSLQRNVLDIDDSGSIGGYKNCADRTSAGAEASYDVTLFIQDQANLNLSYTHSTYTTAGSGIGQLMPTTAIWMAKGYYVHYFSPLLSLSALGKYIGERPRNQEFDESHADNQALDPYFTLDLTLAYSAQKGLNMRFGIKNISDADVRYPSYYDRHEAGLPREGRNFLAEVEYRF